MTAPQTTYIPGVCNIGPAERRMRRTIGWLGVLISVILTVALLAAGTDRGWRLLVWFPATLAAVGFLQSAWHFCAKFGFGGVFNFGATVGKTDTVEQAEFRRKDVRTAVLILVLAALIGAAAAAVAFFLPA